jgi:hypothetical protein
MKRSRTLYLLAAPLAALLIAPLSADVRTRERSQVKFEGTLGRIFNMFGGKAAREGIVATVAVKGDRKAQLGDTNGQIVDLGEEKIYDLDLKKKQYQVITFDELRRQMKEQQERAAREAQKEEGREEKPENKEPKKEWELDFKADETGQKKQVAGYDTRQVIMTVTMREKGKILEEGGGMVMTADTWFGPQIKALDELGAFERRYYEKLYGTDMLGIGADQMAVLMAMYPMLKEVNERLKKEGTKLQGTALATTTVFEVVKSKAQLETEASQQNSGGSGGLSGMLARKVMKKDPPKARATIFTINHEYQEVGTNVAPTDLEIPVGLKEKK